MVQEDFYLDTWLIQPSQYKVRTPQGQIKSVEPKVMDVLICLVEHPDEVVSRQTLMDCVWPDTFVVEDTLTRCISQLRKTLHDSPSQPRLIETIRKGGYRLLVPIAKAPPAAKQKIISRRALTSRTRWVRSFGVTVSLLAGLLLYWAGWQKGNTAHQPETTFVFASADSSSNFFFFHQNDNGK